ncbi:IS3 family transposase [Gordonibacter sp. Marseille-P4307]|uniref:IS3 family transposase n=1 Tax=Gordonibacter sp. Marseille-P4307 TaxID=2161815 RepID=UPI000F53858A
MPPILDEVSHGGADLLVAGRRQMPSHAVPSLAGEIKQRVDKLALLVGGNLFRAEGFFGGLKGEFLFWENWGGIGLDKFVCMLDEYLRRYRDVRLKSDLGYLSPRQHRRSLGLLPKASKV